MILHKKTERTIFRFRTFRVIIYKKNQELRTSKAEFVEEGFFSQTHYEKKLTKNIRPTDILQIYTSI